MPPLHRPLDITINNRRALYNCSLSSTTPLVNVKNILRSYLTLNYPIEKSYLSKKLPTVQKLMDFDTLYELKKRKKPTYNTSGGSSTAQPSKGFTEMLCFVYGTLMDSGQLERLLNRKPDLKEAKVIGYKVMMAGEYPALIKKRNATVYGMAFEMKTAEEVETLEEYETDCYKLTACWIQLKDQESRVMGRTFLWEASPDMVHEGSFDLEEWQAKQLRA